MSTPGAVSSTPCPPGTYSDTLGATSCKLAPAGYFDAGTGNTAATPCPTGMWSAPGASSCTAAIQLLHQAIDAALGSDPGLANSFHQQADSIASAPNANAKAGKLQAFINHVNAQREKALTDAQANNLIALAMRL